MKVSLPKLAASWLRRRGEFDRVGITEPDRSEAEMDDWYWEQDEVLLQIAKTKADDIKGIAAKLRLILHETKMQAGHRFPLDPVERLIVSVERDARRLAPLRRKSNGRV